MTTMTLRPPVTTYPVSNNSNHDRVTWISSLFIMSHVLRLKMDAQFTAACLLHRFLDYHDIRDKARSSTFTRKPSVWIGACLFIAAKVAEDPRRLRDVVNCSQMLRLPLERPPDGSTALPSIHWKDNPPNIDYDYVNTKTEMIQAEQEFLRVIHFDTSVSQPHRAMALLWPSRHPPSRVQEAYSLLHQTLYHVEILRYPVMDVAVAILCLVFPEDASQCNTPTSRDNITQISALLQATSP